MTQHSLSISNFKKSILKFILFALLLLGAVCVFVRVFSIKSGDGIYSMKKFYEQPKDSVDVLILGSSHAYENISTADMWEDYGIAAFDLGGSKQPLWNTYFYLVEALKYQKPKVIVLESYMTTYTEEYQEPGKAISNTFGMRFSMNKVRAICESVPKEDWWSYLLGYVQYHSRYTDLSYADFVKDQGDKRYTNWKGYKCGTLSKINEVTDVRGITDQIPMAEKSEKYFRMIIELAKEEQIPIVVVVSPHANICDNDERIYNYTEMVCTEYGVPFINYNLMYEETGIDSVNDFSDDEHLNHVGSEKLTECLEKYLVSNFELTDHRGDEKWSSWDADALYVERTRVNNGFRRMGSVQDECHLMDEGKYDMFICAEGTPEEGAKEQLSQLFGISIDMLEDAQIIYYHDSKATCWNSDIQIDLAIELDQHMFRLVRETDEEGNTLNQVYVDGVSKKVTDNGYNIVVYDNITGQVVDRFGIWNSNPTACMRVEE